MSGMLASVTSPAEARMALDGGAHIIDCKDPTRGALGDLDPARIRAVLRQTDGRRLVSATVGDVPAQAALMLPAVQRIADTGVDYIKLGLFESGERIAPLLRALAPIAQQRWLIAVLFADRAPDFSSIDALARAGFAGVMLDTAGKHAGGLLQHLDLPTLGQFVERARGHGLLCGLAGSLGLDDIPPLLALNPDYLGFRGALCRGERTSRMDPDALAGVHRAMQAGHIHQAA